MKKVAVEGSQWGDTEKGTNVDDIWREGDVVVRCEGGKKSVKN